MSKIKKIIVIFLFSIFCFLFSDSVKAATLFLMPQSENIFKGDSLIAELMIDTEGENINVADVRLAFPRDLIEIIDFEKGGSIFTLWPEEPDIKKGEISFSAGVPGGFSGKGLIGRINFSGKEVGKAKIDFSEDSEVLLNDGKGTPASLTFLEGNYEILEKPKDLATVSSSTHPEQNKWYKSSTLYLHWDLISGAEYSYILSRDPSAEPDNTPDKPEGDLIWMGDIVYDLKKEKEEDGKGDGIYYFTLKQKLLGKDWSKRIIFRAMIDTTPPEVFKPEIAEIEGKKYLLFLTTDKTSGVDYYEVLETKDKRQETWKIAKSPYILSDQGFKSKILVKAVDKAGNEQIFEISPPPKPFPYWIIIPILIGLIIIWWIIKRLKSKRNK